MDEYSGSVKRASRFLLLVFIVVAAGIVAAGYLSYGHFLRQHRAEEENQLQSIANLKVTEVAGWRQECLRLAGIFYRNTAFSSLVKSYFENPGNRKAEDDILSWLDRIREGSSFDRINLLDRDGRTKLASPDRSASVSGLVAAQAREVLRTRKVSFVDFYRNEYDGLVYLSLLVPVLGEGPGDEPLGVVSLRIDPGKYLYPYINRWPTPSRTAETLIVRREGGYIAFLNETRFMKGTALRLRIPLLDVSKPSVRAALGYTGIVEGIDYRGKRVISYVQPVPESPWFLVARVDLDEAMAHMRERVWLIALFVMILLMAAGASLGYVWRHQLVLFYRERLGHEQALREAEARFRAIYQQSPIAIAVHDDAGALRNANPAFLEMFGLSCEDDIRGFTFFGSPDVPDGQKERLRHGFEVRYEAPLDFGRVRELSLYRTSRRDTVWLDVLISPLSEDAGNPGYLVQVLDITERKRVETALREQFSFLQQLIDAIPLPIFYKDANGRYLGCNRAWETDLGMKREHVLGKTVFDIAPNDLAERYVRADEALLAAGGTQRYETVVRYADGTSHDVIFSKATFTGSDGRVAGIVGCYLDLTERKIAEESLKRSEERLSLAQNAGRVGVFDWDFATDRVVWTPELEEIFGIVRGEFENAYEGWAKRVHPEDLPRIEGLFNEWRASGRPEGQWEYRILRDGEIRWISARGCIIFDAHGNQVRMVGTNLDVTDQKRFEEALKTSEEKYRLITEAIIDVVFTADGEGRYTYISPSHQKVLGRGVEVLGTSIFEHIHPEDLAATLDEYGDAFTRKGTGRIEHRYRHPERGYIWIESQGFVTEINGERTGVLVSRDITDRKKAEDAVIESEMRVRNKFDAIMEPEGDIGSLELADIIDVQALQSLIDDFHRLTGLGFALIDLKGKVLVGAGWQDICTKFHRVHPETLKNCLESDLSLTTGIEAGTFKLYKCRNHMWDLATPIMVGGARLGNLFMGQFFFDDEVPDIEFFRNRAREYGFDEKEYLSALDHVPRFPRETIEACMAFYARLSETISRLSYGNIKLARTLQERDALMRSLQESGEKYRLVADFTYDWEYWLGPDQSYLYVSPSCERITGYTVAEISRDLDFMLEIVHPEDREILADHFRESSSGACGDRSLEFRIKRKDGEVRWIGHVCSPVYASDGTYMGRRGSNRDITSRKEIEQTLMMERNNLRGILDAFSDGVYIVSRDYCIEYVNPVIERIFGPVEGRLCYIYFYDRTGPCPWCKNDDVFAGRTVSWEWESPKNGRIYELLDAPFQNPDGSVSKIEFFHDVTDRKRAEGELREKNAELERFTYMISHDLKSPLVTVKTFLGYLVQDLEKADGERVESDMHYIRTAADRMSLLLDELLEMSRIGRLSNPPVTVTFRELAEEAVSLVAGRISELGVRTVIHDGDVPLHGDRVRLGEIWQNLLENAVMFMGDRKEPVVEIGVDLSGVTPVFFVSDNGMGIEPRFQGKIFDLFEKLDGAGEGTGLGLALVKRIVELYHGTITVQSEGSGKGARFLFTLPDAARVPGQAS